MEIGQREEIDGLAKKRRLSSQAPFQSSIFVDCKQLFLPIVNQFC